MLGALLEPEVLADILEALSHADDAQEKLLVNIMSVLPQCERFDTACMFLESEEKQRESVSLASFATSSLSEMSMMISGAVLILDKIRKMEGNTDADAIAARWKI